MTQPTISAVMLAARISTVLGRTISPKSVRGKVRGDSGKSLVTRYDAAHKPPRAVHAYTFAEADSIGAAYVASANAALPPDAKRFVWTPVSKPLPTAARKSRTGTARKRPAKVPAVASTTAHNGPQTADSTDAAQ